VVGYVERQPAALELDNKRLLLYVRGNRFTR